MQQNKSMSVFSLEVKPANSAFLSLLYKTSFYRNKRSKTNLISCVLMMPDWMFYTDLKKAKCLFYTNIEANK